MDLYSFAGKFSGCGSGTVGKALPATTVFGKTSSTTIGTGVGAFSGGSGGVDFLFFAEDSTRAEARAGNFLFSPILAGGQLYFSPLHEQ